MTFFPQKALKSIGKHHPVATGGCETNTKDEQRRIIEKRHREG